MKWLSCLLLLFLIQFAALQDTTFIKQLEQIRGKVLHQKAVAIANLNHATFQLASLRFRAAKANATYEWAYVLNNRGQQILDILEETQNFLLKYVNEPIYLKGKGPNDDLTSCSDVLMKNIYAKTGYYYINPDLSDRQSFRVFCDMNTMYGGWTRIGVKDANAVLPEDAFLSDFNRDRVTYKELRQKGEVAYLNLNYFSKLENTKEWEIMIKKNDDTFVVLYPTVTTDGRMNNIAAILRNDWSITENIECSDIGSLKICRGAGSSFKPISSKDALEYYIRRAKAKV